MDLFQRILSIHHGNKLNCILALLTAHSASVKRVSQVNLLMIYGSESISKLLFCPGNSVYVIYFSFSTYEILVKFSILKTIKTDLENYSTYIWHCESFVAQKQLKKACQNYFLFE